MRQASQEQLAVFSRRHYQWVTALCGPGNSRNRKLLRLLRVGRRKQLPLINEMTEREVIAELAKLKLTQAADYEDAELWLTARW